MTQLERCLWTVGLVGLLFSSCSKDKGADKRKSAGGGEESPNGQLVLYSTENVPPISSTLQKSIPVEFQTGGTLQVGAPGFLQGCFDRPSQRLGSMECAPPPSSSNILFLVWDENPSYCTDERVASGECFELWDSPKKNRMRFARPASSLHPEICRENRRLSDDKTVALGGSVLSTVCRFENEMALQGKKVDGCSSSSGKKVDLSKYIPWAEEWGLPTELLIQGSFRSSTDDEFYFATNPEVTLAGGEWVVRMSDYGGGNMEVVHFNKETQRYFYFNGSSANGMHSRIAYLGDLSADSSSASHSFESIRMVRYESGAPAHTTRIKSNGRYMFIQTWLGLSPGDSDFKASEPSTFNNDQCLMLGLNFVSSTYVDTAECVAGFSASSAEELNSDAFFSLKMGGEKVSYQNWFQKGASLNPKSNPMGEANVCYNQEGG